MDLPLPILSSLSVMIVLPSSLFSNLAMVLRFMGGSYGHLDSIACTTQQASTHQSVFPSVSYSMVLTAWRMLSKA